MPSRAMRGEATRRAARVRVKQQAKKAEQQAEEAEQQAGGAEQYAAGDAEQQEEKAEQQAAQISQRSGVRIQCFQLVYFVDFLGVDVHKIPCRK
jgi:hypothetical protein